MNPPPDPGVRRMGSAAGVLWPPALDVLREERSCSSSGKVRAMSNNDLSAWTFRAFP